MLRKYSLLSVFVVVLLLIALVDPVNMKSKKKKSLSPTEKKLKNIREELKRTKCGHLTEELSTQCQNYYISPYCF